MKGFETKMQAVCTCWCIGALVVAGASTALVHMAFSKLITPLIDLPSNLDTGLQQTFHFNELEADITLVRDTANSVLFNSTKCNYPANSCSALPISNVQQNITAELMLIQEQFDKALSTVEMVANDKYLGIGDFRTLGDSLKSIQTELEQMRNASMPAPCRAFGQAFCEIHTKSNDVISVMGDINSGLASITNSEAVTQFEEHSDRYKNLVHVLPYVFWISVLFYLCLFIMKTPSCKGGCLNCTFCSVHVVFFLISFVLSAVIFVAGIVAVKGAEEVKLEDPFVGQPTLKMLVDHLEMKFPEFYDLVLRDLLDGMARTYQAYLVFTVAHIMLLVHTCSCCCGIYTKSKEQLKG